MNGSVARGCVSLWLRIIGIAIAGGFTAALVLGPQAALAQCATSGSGPVTFTCATNTTTTETTNTTSPASTSDRTQQFATGITGSVNSGVTVSGNGIALLTTSTNPGDAVSMANSGTISNSNNTTPQAALLLTNSAGATAALGTFTYTGNGNVTNTSTLSGAIGLAIENLSGTTTNGGTSATIGGTISSAGDAGVNLVTANGGNNTLSVLSGGVVSGLTQGASLNGDGTNMATNAGTISATGTGSVGLVSGTGLTMINSGTVSGVLTGLQTVNALSLTNNAGGTIQGTGTGSTGIVAGETGGPAGSLSGSNAGIITGDAFGISSNGLVSLTSNSNTISATGASGTGISADGVTITSNTGTISGGANGIMSSDVVNITSSGTISGGTGAAINSNTASLTLTNNTGGVVSGATNGITGGSITLTNSGQVTSTSGSAVLTAGNAMITNNTGGLIQNSDSAFDTAITATTLTMTNAGTVQETGTSGSELGILTFGNTSITNSGTISAGFVTVLNEGAATATTSVTNNAGGMIEATAATSAAILTLTGLNVINSGTITAPDVAINPQGAASASITNNAGGVISGGNVGIFFADGPIASTVFNAGTITGSTAAIEFSSGSVGNTLTLGSGFVINGAVMGAGSDILQLGGTGNGSFNLSNIGSQYTGFTTFNVISAIWNATGTSSQNWSISNGATLLLGNGTTAGLITGNIADNGTFGFDNPAGTITLGGLISGSGNVAQAGSGTTILTAANTYMGGTTVSGGTLQLSGNGTLGASSGATTVSGGVLDLGGTTQTQNGGLTLTGGTVQDGTLSSSGIFALQAGTVTASLTGTAALDKTGAGTVILDGANTYAGGTTVAGGTLEVGDIDNPQASIAGNVTVDGGTLAGHGTIGGSVTDLTGTVAPGGTIGTLTVAGNYTQGSAGTLSIEVSPTQASKLAVGGAANLAGTLALVFDPGVYTPTSYTLLTAQTLSGTFATVTGTNPSGLPQTILFENSATDPSVLLQLGFGGTVAPTNDTVYSAATSIAVINAQEINGIILDRIGQRQAGIADGGIAALTPGGLSGVQLAQAGSGNSAALGDLAAALPQLGEDAWFRGIGGFASVNGNSSAPGFTGSTGGFLAGYDRAVAPNLYLGVAGGYLHSNIDEHSTSSGAEESARFNVYGGMLAGPSLFSATAGYAHDWFSTDRGFAGIGAASENHGGNEATAAGQWSLPLPITGYGGGIATLTPKAGIQYLHLSEDAFAETGADGLDLGNAGHGTDSLQPYVGAALAQKFVTQGGLTIAPELRLGYAHEVFDSRLVTVTAAGGAAFPVEGVKPSRDQMTAGLGIVMQTAPNLSAYADYDTILHTGNTTEQTVQAGLRLQF